MRLQLILIILFTGVSIGQEADSVLKQTFPVSKKINHRPPMPFFEGRPYYLELFSDLPENRLESITLFFKTDQSMDYREIPLDYYRGRYRFKYDPVIYPGKELTYFFVAIVKGSGSYASPVDENGKLVPMVIEPMDPIKYYERITPK